ncbi:7TM GPCR, serpentine receptor class j (Srj) family-containing protein [Aphelenchoides besseyi]|nr:7TM GPCR, serpentine receptor class j (Srj) family-containing protein [Aphelenchoides besseyi]KAI6237752.1 7TM GPCR, serpentine receptor class j (Srj) family-containing protein [Aphelenchoides besseyi]
MPEDLRFLRFYHSIFEFVIGIISYILNGTLIYMALYKSTKYMKSYSAIIILNSSVDIIFNTINIVVQVVVDMKDGGLYFFSGYFVENIPQPYASYMHNLWMFGLLLSVVNVPVQFLFRYLILVKNKTLNGLELLGVMLVPAVLIAIHCYYGATVAYSITDEERNELLPSLQNDPLWFHDVPVFSHGFVKNRPVQIDFCGTQGVVVISYIVIFWTGRAIYNKLKSSEKIMSRPTRLAQAQLTKILLIESMIPISTCFPITYCIFTVSYGINIPLVGLSMATMASSIPLVNAICIIFIVPSYRRFIFRLLPQRYRPTVHTEVTQVFTSNPLTPKLRLKLPADTTLISNRTPK